MMNKKYLSLSLVLAFTNAQAFDIQVAHEGIRVAGNGQVNVFATPIDYSSGAIFTANVEPPANGASSNKLNYQTVVRKATKNSQGNWVWSHKVIDQTTLDDQYHTQPSIAVDKNGKVHVAYNMHNMPWQYVVSDDAHSINSFTFKGQAVTLADLRRVKIDNMTNFPTLGSASIPGNQITYPAFFKDKNNDLYITYRQALKPKLAWANRVYASGIAKYDATGDHWFSIGGNYVVKSGEANLANGASSTTVKPFAERSGWALYQTRLAFDQSNNMHVSWYWRDGGAGPELTNPSYAISRDGGASFSNARGRGYTLPITLDQIQEAYPTSNRVFNSTTNVSVTSSGTPYRMLSDINLNKTVIAHFDERANAWKTETPPSGAPLFFIDSRDVQWAVASGPIIYKRDTPTSSWVKMHHESGYGSPKVHQKRDGSGYFLHLQSNNKNWVKIWDITTSSAVVELPERPTGVQLSFN